MASTVSTTTLSFGLVTVPVRLKAGSKTSGIELKLASPDGNPVKQTYVDETTGEVIGTSADCVRGIFDPDGFHEVPKEALKAIDEAVKIEGISITGFVPLDEVPFERAEAAYFIAPAGKGGPATVMPLVALRDALTSTGRAGIGSLTLRTRQRPFVIHEVNDGLILTTLAFAAEVAALAEAAVELEGVEVDPQIAGFATTLIESLAVEASALDAITDERTDRRNALIADALAGKAIPVTEKAAAPKTDTDLASLLAASVELAATAKTAKKKAA